MLQRTMVAMLTLAILTRWEDAKKVAGATARVSLAGPVSELQAIRREVDAITAPDCAAATHALLVDSMDTTVNAYLAFMKKDSEREIAAQLSTATKTMGQYLDELNALARGVPIPTVAPTKTVVTLALKDLGGLAWTAEGVNAVAIGGAGEMSMHLHGGPSRCDRQQYEMVFGEP